MKKLVVILVTIMVVWMIVAAIDLAAVNLLGRPLLCIRASGGDAVFYYGLGYTITEFFPLAPSGQQDPYMRYSFGVFIVGNIILLVTIICGIIATKIRAAKNSGKNGVR